MEDAVFVFQEGENREKARALKRRHSEIFRLEGKCEPHPRVFKIFSKVGFNREVRIYLRQQLQHPGIDHIPEPEESVLDTRAEQFKLPAVVRQKAAEARGVSRI